MFNKSKELLKKIKSSENMFPDYSPNQIYTLITSKIKAFVYINVCTVYIYIYVCVCFTVYIYYVCINTHSVYIYVHGSKAKRVYA